MFPTQQQPPIRLYQPKDIELKKELEQEKQCLQAVETEFMNAQRTQEKLSTIRFLEFNDNIQYHQKRIRQLELVLHIPTKPSPQSKSTRVSSLLPPKPPGPDDQAMVDSLRVNFNKP